MTLPLPERSAISDGVPASANAFLFRQILREEWGFEGFVVSDWASIEQLSIHGLTANDRESAHAAVTAGVNMEMATSTYADHLPGLLQDGKVDIELIDMDAEEIAVVGRMQTLDRAEELDYQPHRLDGHPVWSRDYQSICFQAAPEGNRQLFLADLSDLLG